MSKHHSNGSPPESKNGALPLSNDEFIGAYTPLVRLIAERIHQRLPPGVDLESLIHAGIVGILEAKARFDPKRGAVFQTYARYRIQGEIMEYLRSLDWASRSIRSWGRRVESAKKRMVDRVHRQTTDEEVAEELGISLEAYFRVEAKLDQAIMVALEDVNIIDRTHPSIEDPETIVERAALLDRLVVCREELPERERLVIALYYEEELTLQEIAEMLDVTEGRICQIHNTALLFLRDIFDQPSVKKSAAVPPVSTGDEIAADLLFLLEDTPPLDTEDIVQSLQTLFDDP